MLNIRQGSLLILIVTVTQDSLTQTPMSNKVSLVVYTVAKTWNEAQKICENIGGTLYTQNSAERGHVLSHYMDDSSWPLNNKDVWVGLHSPEAESASNFGWTNCVSLSQTLYTNWKDNEPSSPTEKCGVVDKVHYYWRSEACSDDNEFLCEKTESATCTYTVTQHRPSASAVYESLTLTVTDREACWQECLARSQNTKNCWALNWIPSATSDNCMLYFVDNPFYFTSSVLDSDSADFLVKDCYSLTSMAIYTVANENSINPVAGCSSFDAVTTTSTTSTTTSTTSTSTTTTASTTTTTPTTTTTTTTTPTTTTPTTTTSTTTTSTTTTPTTTTPTATTSTTTTPTTTTSTTTTPATTTPTTSITTTTYIATTTSTSPGTTTTASTSSTSILQSTTTDSTTTSLTNPTTTSSTSTLTTVSPLTQATATSTAGTIATVFTTPSQISTTTSANSLCNCSCSKLKSLLSPGAVDPVFANLTVAEKVAVLQLRLKLNTSKLSSTIRKKTSATDNRTESKAIGYVGVTFLCIVFVPIVISDAFKLLAFLYEYLKKGSTVDPTNESS